MLIVQRKLRQSFYITDAIKITFIGMRGRGTEAIFGIDAPKSMLILREELIDKIKHPAMFDATKLFPQLSPEIFSTE